MNLTLLSYAKSVGLSRISKSVVAGTETGFPCFFLSNKEGTQKVVVMLSQAAAKEIAVGTPTSTLYDREIRVHEDRPYLVADAMVDLPE